MMKTNIKKLKSQFVQQHGQSDCGVACLAAITQYYGGEKTLDEIRSKCGTTQNGTTLLGLFQGAEQLGFTAQGLEAEGIDNLKELKNPAILHVILDNKIAHYVVFHGFKGDDLIIGDPAKGIEIWTRTKLEEMWVSKALLNLQPADSFEKVHRKNNRYKNLIGWIKEDTNILLSSLFLGILIAILSLAMAVFSQKLIDVILPSKDTVKLVVGICLLALVLLAKNALGFIRSTFLITQSKSFNNRMISDFFKSMLQLPKSFFDSKKTGELIARMNDTRKIQTTISSLVGNLLVEFLVIIISLVGVFAYSWEIGLVLLGFMPFYLIIIKKLNQPIIDSQQNVMSAYALNESNYVDVMTGISEVKSTGRISLFHRYTTLLYNNFQQQFFGLGKIQIRFNFLNELIGIILMVTVVAYSSSMVLNDSLMLGSMMAILSLSASIGPALTRIAISNIQLQEAKVAFNRMEEFTSLTPEKMEGTTIDTITNLEIRHMTFHFAGTLKLLNDICMYIQKGKLTTLLGESGSGKSTILQLIQRFYEPIKGDILVNGQRIENFALDSYRNQLAVISQDTKIFNHYLLFNIALSEDPKEMEAALNWCRKNGFDEYFLRFPQGYATLLGEEGANISGGQKQILALARALYRKPSLLLIDEGTSAMDRRTEKFAMQVIQNMKNDIAILMVTHKLQTALESDVVYLLEDGKIIDAGDPETLISKKNFFSESYHELVLS